MAIKEYCNEDLIFTDKNERTLEVYNKYVNIHEVTAITTIIIIIVTEQPMNTTPIIKKTSKATNMEPELAQPMEMATNTPKILQKITKKR